MGGVEHFASDHAVFEEDHAVCVRGGVRIVCDHQNCLFLFGGCIPQKFKHLSTRVRVEVTGRLIRKNHLGPGQ